MNALVQWLVGAVAVCAALYLALVLVLVATGRWGVVREVAAFVPDCAVLFSRLLRDRRVRRRDKLLLAGLVGYLAMPIDVVPDFIPVAGQLDDAILVALVLRHVVRREGHLLEQHWPGSPTGLDLLHRLGGSR